MDRADSFASLSAFPLHKLTSFKSRRSLKSRSRADGQVALTSVPSSLAPRTPVLSRLPASIQHLPTEIVLNIVSYALPSVYIKAVRFKSDPIAFFNDVSQDFREVLSDTQTCLARIALVCKGWYPVATEFLYGCPFLGSSSKVLSFLRSLRSCEDLRGLVQEVWVFNEEGSKNSDLIGIKRKSTRRVQADLLTTLRALTSLNSVIVCNHGLIDHHQFPIDNVLLYTLPLPSAPESIPEVVTFGPSVFNTPWTRHAKPNSFYPDKLQALCIRDIEISPAELRCAPSMPTLPTLRTLKVGMFNHNETPYVSSGTYPALRRLEVYRDVFDNHRAASMRPIAVEPATIRMLESLFLVGRVVESALFKVWADQLLFCELKHLAIGLLHPREHAFLSEWRLPDHLQTLELVVWHNPRPMKQELGEMGDARGALEALQKCLHKNRQSRSFKRLVVRATSTLPPKEFNPIVRAIQEDCTKYGFMFELHEGDIQSWISERLASSSL